MAKKLKDALARHRAAAEDLDRALRDCLRAFKDQPDNVVEGRFRLNSGRNHVTGRAASSQAR